MQTVLLVEDEAAIRMMVTDVLQAAGYRVLAAPTLAEARRLVDAEPAIELVVLDRALSDGEGLEFCSRLKSDAATSDLPVIVLTGQLGLASEAASYEHGADLYLAKPAPPDRLRAYVQALLARSKRTVRPAAPAPPSPAWDEKQALAAIAAAGERLPEAVREACEGVRRADGRLFAAAYEDRPCGSERRAAHLVVLAAHLCGDEGEEAVSSAAAAAIAGAPPAGGVHPELGWLAHRYHELVHHPAEPAKPYEAMEALLAAAASMCTRDAVRRFLAAMTPFPPGCLVRLNSGKWARVVRTDPAFPTRPVIRFSDAEPEVDLRSHPLLRIEVSSRR